MTAEDRSRSDENIAQKLAQLREQTKTDPFPLPRIEDIAAGAMERLQGLRERLSAEELGRKPTTADPLTAANENDKFVVSDVGPLVIRLLDRTGMIVQVDQSTTYRFGYAATTDSNDENKKLRLVAEDVVHDYSYIVESPADLQIMWDTAPFYLRESIRKFGTMTRSEILDAFTTHVQEYLPR